MFLPVFFLGIVRIPSCTSPTRTWLVDTRDGHIKKIKGSGEVPEYCLRPDFGQMPAYLVKRNRKIQKALDKIRYAEEHKESLCKLISEENRQKLLNDLKHNWQLLQKAFLQLPMLTDTIPKILKKTKMEQELRQLEKDIALGNTRNLAIVQTACWYLDTILGMASFSTSDKKFLALACYWISGKLHGSMNSSKKLIKYSKRACSVSQLVEAEKTILKRLNFPTHPVIPQDFISYLCWYCDQRNYREIETAATVLTMSGMMVNKELCQEFPSVIGALAVENAMHLLGKMECLERLKTCPLYRVAIEKTPNSRSVSAILLRALRKMGDPSYKYNAAIKQCGRATRDIADKIILSLTNYGNTYPYPSDF